MATLYDLDTPADAAAALQHEWLVACLCADWCGTCREYQPGFEAIAERFPEAGFLWVDIETHADWADDVDVENFPTLFVMQGEAIRFFGTMLPYPAHLERALESLFAPGAHHLPVDGAEDLPSLRDLLRARAG
ncbi:thioredoxin family protein [Nitrogeniibacter mangrovi]|uniref:Thioredoxin family protein n=2 Tax=Nitrogeniibacter mangrovi TaxID=2016596 RepID=A0A6C1B5A6_9RHOO|nr:thioredoxin family protein [Nitrogeniibacter mangrovi]